jgi:hypothetical protein
MPTEDHPSPEKELGVYLRLQQATLQEGAPT